MAGWDTVHAWLIEAVREVVPRLDPQRRFTCIDDATGRTTSLEDLVGKDRFFDVRLPADEMPTPDEEMDCCGDCGHMISAAALRIRYRSTGDQGALTRRVGVDLGRIAKKLCDPAEWPANVYNVEIDKERDVESVRPPQAEAPAPFAGLSSQDPETAFIVTTTIRIWYQEEGV